MDVTAIFYLFNHLLPDLQQKMTYTVSGHQKKGIWRAIAKEVRTLGDFSRRSTHCCKRWEDLHRWARKMAEA
ncbi:hypothetical protein NDU88_002784 [Pleurodeles waltl]|uniref:Myb/SANT-like DNA-binding domain-containing protein n=1 Tax=Pleurodeles waltl TaxID=8319 RepID=A0AAV7T374_PLEWA|nr:hypothetical protein NDU88_002784 [Pleurodeles waltl]